jgi:micrococcal nuclease
MFNLRKIIFLVALLILLPLLSGCVVQDNLTKLVSSAKATYYKPVDYFKVTKVVDGDTLDISYFGKTERIRLIGINTPEVVDPRRPVECFGKEASAEARKLLEGKLVRIASDPTQDNRDKYGRLLRYVTTQDGLFYNLEIIKRGFAYEYTYLVPYKYQKDFKTAQSTAQTGKLGLWADKACVKATPKKAIVPVSTSTQCQIKGNISSKQKIYHLTSCPDYKKTVINPAQGERFFCTEQEAQKAGFRRAKNCQ